MANGVACGYDAVADVHTLGKRLAQVHAKEFAHDGGVAGTRANPRFDLLNAKPLASLPDPCAANYRRPQRGRL
jgi:hypothetical protein